MPIPLLDSPDIHVVRGQFEAWMDGCRARLLGMLLHENPHPSRSYMADAWENAWETVDRMLKDRLQQEN